MEKNGEENINANIPNEIDKEVNEKGKTPNQNFIIIIPKDTLEINGELFKEIENEAKNKILNNNRLFNFYILVDKKRINYINISMDLMHHLNMEL